MQGTGQKPGEGLQVEYSICCIKLAGLKRFQDPFHLVQVQPVLLRQLARLFVKVRDVVQVSRDPLSWTLYSIKDYSKFPSSLDSIKDYINRR
mmetsp:Transcript_64475/g.104293  ORF Transcript_64475/g.104293 Transcript_64475/m.104293 type:complete len:92 (+) Transcript_64475:223-498(+)